MFLMFELWETLCLNLKLSFNLCVCLCYIYIFCFILNPYFYLKTNMSGTNTEAKGRRSASGETEENLTTSDSCVPACTKNLQTRRKIFLFSR